MDERVYISRRGKVHYWVEPHPDDTAPTMVFLHGLTANHTLFDRQIDYFKPDYNILVWDAPGHGFSRPYRDFTYENLAHDLVGIFIAEDITSAIMVGQSMGGYVIQALALAHPEYIDAFIGIDTCPFGTAYYSKSDLWWLNQVGWMMSCYPYKTLLKSIAKNSTCTKLGYDNMLASLEQFDNKQEICAITDLGYKRLLRIIDQEVEWDCPVFIIVGKNDKTGKVWQYCKAWHLATDYPLRVIPKAAHNSNVDNPAEVNQAISKFLEEQGL